MFKISSLDHIGIGVKDAEISVKWYQEVLGLEKLTIKEWGSYPVFMVSNDRTGIAIFQNRAGNPVSMPEDRKTGLPHIAFKVSFVDFENAQKHLDTLNLGFEYQDHFIAHSIYFRDPDNYCIEITTYEI